MSFSSKIISGSLWLVISNFGARFFQLISSIVLTRIIAPEEYGLAAISVGIIGITEQVSSLFLETALIQKERDDIAKYLNTAWTFNLIRYAFLSTVLFVFAFFSADLFNSPRLPLVIQVSSLVMIITGLKNIGTIYFRKDLDFKKNFFLEILPMIPSLFFSLLLGFILKNVWAFIISSLITNSFSCFLTYKLHPFRPKFEFSFSKFKDLFGFGKWILGKSLLLMFKTNGFNVFIGKVFNINTLGYYNRGMAFSYNVINPFTTVLWQLFYPALSNLKSSDIIVQMFKKIFIFIFLIFSPLIIGAIYFSNDFVYLFLSAKWEGIIVIMQYLFFLSFFNVVNTLPNVYFDSIGKPKYNSHILMIETLAILISIYPLVKTFGIIGALLSLILGQFIMSIVYFISLIRLFKIKILQKIKLFITIIFYPVILTLFILFINLWKNNLSWLSFITNLLVYTLFSVSMIYFWDKITNVKALKTIVEFIKKKFLFNKQES
ncbi:MAG: oligosaccharide flippase family protein [Ignavibacteriales bacterium]|nr:oligosaccharide flippase family protein [Ignavibacteriales bacterium]